jgi:hypothetical protein
MYLIDICISENKNWTKWHRMLIYDRQNKTQKVINHKLQDIMCVTNTHIYGTISYRMIAVLISNPSIRQDIMNNCNVELYGRKRVTYNVYMKHNVCYVVEKSHIGQWKLFIYNIHD